MKAKGDDLLERAQLLRTTGESVPNQPRCQIITQATATDGGADSERIAMTPRSQSIGDAMEMNGGLSVTAGVGGDVPIATEAGLIELQAGQGGSSLVLGAGGNANGKGGALCALSGARSESVMTSESSANGKMVVGNGDASARSGNMVIPNILMNGTASLALMLCSVLFCPPTPTIYATVISIHFCALNSTVCSVRRQYGGIMVMLVMMVIALPGTDSDVRNKEQTRAGNVPSENNLFLNCLGCRFDRVAT